MATIQKLEKEVNEKINNLTIEELRALIKRLAKDYYKTYFEKNIKSNIAIRDTLKLIGSKYPELNTKSFINYCLLSEVNSILNNNLESNVNLLSFENDLNNNITEKEFKSLKEREKEANEYFKRLEKEMALES